MRSLAPAPETARLDGAFERLRSVHGDDLTGGAADRAAQLLAPMAGSQSDNRWLSSKLTADGFPLEFTFRRGNDGIRFACEVWAPATTPAARVARAIETVGGIGPADEAAVLDAHRGHPLRWGAWVGVRTHAGGETLKLYAEVPGGAQAAGQAWLSARLGHPVVVEGRPIVVRMVGLEPSSGGVEVYCRIFDLRPWELRRLLSPVGLAHRELDVLDLLEDAYEGALHRRLPARTLGFSYAWAPGRAATFSLFAFASTMFGGDARTRSHMLRLARRRGWAFDDYERVSEPLARKEGAESTHGMFGVTMSGGSDGEVTIGLSPPDER